MSLFVIHSHEFCEYPSFFAGLFILESSNNGFIFNDIAVPETDPRNSGNPSSFPALTSEINVPSTFYVYISRFRPSGNVLPSKKHDYWHY